MPSTYSQVYTQALFAVRDRQNLIAKESMEELHQYIAGIISGKRQEPLLQAS